MSEWSSGDTGAAIPSMVEPDAMAEVDSMAGADDVDAIDEAEELDDILVLEEVSAPTLPVWEPTGDPAVDAALEELSRIDEYERSEQIAVFESVHRRLHERLSDLAAGS